MALPASNFRGAEFVPPAVAKKIKDSTPMYIDIYGLPAPHLKDYNGIYKRAAFWNKRAAYRFENSIYTSDDGPYLWWSKGDGSWHLSFWEEAKNQKGANAGGSPLAMLKQDINNPALHTHQWHIAKNYNGSGVGGKVASFVYETDPNVKAAQSWKEHVDETEATGFNRVIVVSKSGGVCYSNTNEYDLGDGEFASLRDSLQVCKSNVTHAEELNFFGFGTPFNKYDPGTRYARLPNAPSGPAALAQKGWVDAYNEGRLWSGNQRVQEDGRTINWRIVVWRLQNFWIVALQNQWTCETAAQKMIKIGTPLVTEGW